MNLRDLVPSYYKVEETLYTYKFTVFTPVFNCEKTIESVHQSLINQTYQDFEWLIINDGSTDRSHAVISNLIKTSPLNIHYINNSENQHKMGCFIQAIALAKGEFLLTFDGDDECLPHALQTFNQEYSNIPENLKHKIGAVTGLCQDQLGNGIGDIYPHDPFYSNTFESNNMNHILGEKWGFTKTSVLRGVKINDQIFSKGLIPESIIWNLIAKEGFITKYINKSLRIYHVDVENSLSSTSVKNRAFGSVIDSIAGINWFFNTHLFKTPVYFLKKLYVLIRASVYLRYTLKDYLNAIDSKLVKILIVLLWPFRKLIT